MQLENKIALITGGATGIGGATTQLFGERGATVLIADYNEADGQARVALAAHAIRLQGLMASKRNSRRNWMQLVQR